MTRLLFSALLISPFLLFIISCSKEKNTLSPGTQKITSIQSNTWVLDSTNTITATYNGTLPEVPPSFFNFFQDTMTENFQGTSLIKYGIMYEAPDKIYFWLPGETKNSDEYLIIDSINDSSLVMKEIDIIGGRTRIRYYHAQ